MRSHGLPVLRADDVKETVGQPLLHGGVEDLKELGPDVRLDAAKAGEKGWLQLRRELRVLEVLVRVHVVDEKQELEREKRVSSNDEKFCN